MTVLLRKAFVVSLITAVLTTLWIAAAEPSVRVPVMLKSDGTALYRDAVAASGSASRSAPDATSVLTLVRSLVTG
jgi:hypothetical protein